MIISILREKDSVLALKNNFNACYNFQYYVVLQLGTANFINTLRAGYDIFVL